MSVLTGKVILKVNQTVLITMSGSWSVNRALPSFYAYGALGYIGSAVGTEEDVNGDCNFVIPASGLEIDLYNFQVVPFELDWPMGDPAFGNVPRFKAIDCRFSGLNLSVDSTKGQTMIRGSLKAGKLDYPKKISP